MTYSASRIAAFVDEASGTFSQAQACCEAGGWKLEDASALQERLGALGDYAGALGLAGIEGALLDLYAYLGLFAEGEPKPAQRLELAALLESARAALRAVDAGRGAAPPALVFLLAHGPAAHDLAAALRRDGLRMVAFADREHLEQGLRERLPQAILVAPADTAAVSEMLGRLAGGETPSGEVVLVAVGACTPEQRLQSLLDGADVCLGRLPDAGFGAQLRELVGQHSASPPRVMVVDGDRQMCAYFEALLRRAGMQVECVSVAAEAGAKMHEFRPDLVLMDLRLPDTDGLTLSAQLRREANAPVLPIVFVSSDRGERARFRAIQAGGDDFLVKPIRPGLLVATVRSRIARVRTLHRQLCREQVDAQGGMRRGAFLDHLRTRLLDPPARLTLLVIVNVDHAEQLQQSLPLSAIHELEQALVWRLTRHLRPGDAYALIHEFCVGILLQRDHRADLARQAEALRESVSAQPFRIEDGERALTASIGLALLPGDGRGGVDGWIDSAFSAARTASRLGGNRVEGLLSDPPAKLDAERQEQIRQLLRQEGFDHRVHLNFEFQPLVPLRGHEVGRYALGVRLRDRRAPLHGIERHEFLPVARAEGMQVGIDRQTLRRGLVVLGDQRSGSEITDLMVPVDFLALDRVQIEWIEESWRSLPHGRRHLTLQFDAGELIESADAGRKLARLQAVGLRLAAADRSGRLSALTALVHLPLHLLCMPARAVLATEDGSLAPLLQAWYAAGRTLLVTGVEDLSQVAKFWSLGIDYLQGESIAAAGCRPDFDFSEISLG